nr:glycosyltransferase family 39 protein [Thermoflexus sp.]
MYPEFNNWPANYAFALNMVYAIPMALGSDRAPQLVHWTFGIALLGIAYRLPRSAAGSLAWIAPAFVLTMPAFLFQLAPQALLDVAAACLEVMTFGGLMRAAEQRSKQWLIAAGIWAGLAVGTKLSSLPVLVAGLIFWIWRGRSTSWIERASGILYFLLPALALTTPWYLKNALWFGAPLFPAGLESTDPEVRFRNLLFLEYINQGEQQGINRLLFFYWLLTAPDRLDYVTGPLALWFLPLLLLAAPLQGPALDALALSGLRALLWIISPPGIRFLISTFALLGVALAITAGQGWRDPRLPRRLAARWIASSHLMFIAVLLLTVGAASVFSQPWRVALGLESRADYLRRKLEGYRGMEYVRDHLGPEDRILLIADARHYYCPSRCYPEADHFTWPRIVWASQFNPKAVLDRLEAMEITHLWIHHGSVKWLLAHDPQGWMRRSYDFLRIQIAPSCAARMYSDEDVEILRLLCRSGADHRGHERDISRMGSEDSRAGGAP